jgi:hypothetical protein
MAWIVFVAALAGIAGEGGFFVDVEGQTRRQYDLGSGLDLFDVFDLATEDATEDRIGETDIYLGDDDWAAANKLFFELDKRYLVAPAIRLDGDMYLQNGKVGRLRDRPGPGPLILGRSRC